MVAGKDVRMKMADTSMTLKKLGLKNACLYGGTQRNYHEGHRTDNGEVYNLKALRDLRASLLNHDNVDVKFSMTHKHAPGALSDYPCSANVVGNDHENST